MKRKRGKHSKKNSLLYRFILVFLVVFVLGGIVGGIIAASISNAHSGKAEQETNDSANGGATVITREQTFEPLECDLSESLQEYTYNLCKAYEVDFCFAMGLMYTESGFAADTISGTNDYGLMQVNIINADEIADKLGIYELTEPHLNIHAGLYLLGKLWKEYQGDRAKVCMAYNLGEHGAAHLWEQGIYETEYSKKVLAQAAIYQNKLGAEK